MRPEGFLGRDLDALDLFEFLDARLHLLRLGGFVAEAVDEGFEMLDALLLVAPRGEQLLAAFFLLLQVGLVAAGVEVDRPVPQLGDLPHGDVEEVAVVRDEHEGVGVGAEIVLEPVARFEIEMVGGLVEQQEVGLLEQELRQCDAHLPAAGEVLGAARPVFLRKTEAGEDHADPGLERVAVHVAEVRFEPRVPAAGGLVFGIVRRQRGELLERALHLALHFTEAVEDGEALFEHGAPGQLQAVLRQVAGGDSLLHGALAGVERFESGEDAHERRFARAVGADQADAVLRRDEPGDVFEDDLRTEALAGADEADHGWTESGRWRRMRPPRASVSAPLSTMTTPFTST